MLVRTFSLFCLGRCYRHARCPKNDPGFQRKCKAKCDYLRCPFPFHHHHHPNVQKVKQPTEMQKNSSSVGRFSAPISVGSLGIKFLLDSLCNIFLYPRQKLGSLRGGLAEKTTWIREAWQRDPSIKQDHLLFDHTGKKKTRLGCPRLDAPTLPGSRKLQSHRHTEPHRRIS